MKFRAHFYGGLRPLLAPLASWHASKLSQRRCGIPSSFRADADMVTEAAIIDVGLRKSRADKEPQRTSAGSPEGASARPLWPPEARMYRDTKSNRRRRRRWRDFVCLVNCVARDAVDDVGDALVGTRFIPQTSGR